MLNKYIYIQFYFFSHLLATYKNKSFFISDLSMQYSAIFTQLYSMIQFFLRFKLEHFYHVSFHHCIFYMVVYLENSPLYMQYPKHTQLHTFLQEISTESFNNHHKLNIIKQKHHTFTSASAPSLAFPISTDGSSIMPVAPAKTQRYL